MLNGFSEQRDGRACFVHAMHQHDIAVIQGPVHQKKAPHILLRAARNAVACV